MSKTNLNTITAKIHSLESFGAVDGPGIRYIIFMQGCPLKCKYCHNRDSWDPAEGKVYTLEDILNHIIRCRPYIDMSQGGVTVSGGEPLLQTEFIINLFKELKKLNIHTCIDTAGSIPINDSIKELLSLTDLVLLDIKHIDNEKCINLTGAPNKNTLDFAKYLSDNNIKMWIRQVLVPGYTDNQDDLKETRKFIDTLKTVEKVEVLPYHNLGAYKWKEKNIPYPLEGVNPPSKESINLAKSILVKDCK